MFYVFFKFFRMFNDGSYSSSSSSFTSSEASIFSAEPCCYVAYLGGTDENDLKNYFYRMNFTTYSGFILSRNCRKR
jgi:hypothetical protein